MHWRIQLLGAACICAIGFAAHTQTAVNDYKHLGVASCASTVCHGKATAQPDRHVEIGRAHV